MDILVLGGTRFVGRHIVEAFIAAGHRVTVFTRGKADVKLPDSVTFLTGDRDAGPAGLADLEGRQWDTCVDVSGYQPGQVRASTELLQERVGRYVFISTASVYAEQNRALITETDPLLPAFAGEVAEITFETYGSLKVACEALVERAFPNNFTILRPQLIAGPHDYTPRYAYWPDRAARGGQVLVPGDGQDFMQVIDAHDLARFVVRVVEQSIGGIFNVAGPKLTWAEFMQVLGVQDMRWVSSSELDRLGASPDEFPAYLSREHLQSGVMSMSNAKALAAGLTLTDPARTARETREWSQYARLNYSMTPERESELLAQLLS